MNVRCKLIPLILLFMGCWSASFALELKSPDGNLVLTFDLKDLAAAKGCPMYGVTYKGRTVIAVMHDMPLVQEHFPQALMLARELVAWGSTAEALRDENLARAQKLAETWMENAGVDVPSGTSGSDYCIRATGRCRPYHRR